MGCWNQNIQDGMKGHSENEGVAAFSESKVVGVFRGVAGICGRWGHWGRGDQDARGQDGRIICPLSHQELGQGWCRRE